MILLTLELIGLFSAAWKTPVWVKEIGLLALITSILPTLTGLYHAFGVLAQAPDVSPSLMYMSLRLTLITIIYGVLIYGFSLILRIIQAKKS